eukprot:2028881-Amphidinium_carterae.1
MVDISIAGLLSPALFGIVDAVIEQPHPVALYTQAFDFSRSLPSSNQILAGNTRDAQLTMPQSSYPTFRPSMYSSKYENLDSMSVTACHLRADNHACVMRVTSGGGAEWMVAASGCEAEYFVK